MNTTKTETKPTTVRGFIPARLAKQYLKDYEASHAPFPADKKIELTEHLLECLDIIEQYLSNPTKENWDTYAKKEHQFLKKQGKRLKIYHQKNIYLYYGDSTVLVEKEIYTTEEWNALSSQKQKLNPEELTSFIDLCRNSLLQERDFLLLEQSAEDEITTKEKGNKEALTGTATPKKGKVKREANDNKTSLTQEQTVLLMHYLQQERVILKDEHLTDMEAGKAFELLTGYSQHTLRQNFGKYYHYQNKTNLKEIDNLLTRMKIAISKDLKEK